MKRVIYTNRELVVTIFLVLACVLLNLFFDAQGAFQKILSLAGFFVLAPALYVKFILKKKWSDFGLQKGDWKKGVGGIIIALVVSLLILYILINYFGFLESHGAIGKLKGNFGAFLYYEAVLIFSILLAFGVFFQGLILFVSESRLWRLSVLIQFLLFLLFLWISGGFQWDATYYIISAFFSGVIVYQSRSLLYGIAYSWIFVVIADAIVIRLVQ